MPRTKLSRRFPVSLLLALLVFPLVYSPRTHDLHAQAPEEDLDVLATWRMYTDAPNFLYKHIAAKAFDYLDRRSQELASIHGREGWGTYRDSVRARLALAFGPLPEKTPLNARVTGKFSHQGISIEKILFESRPSFLVSAAFFKPEGAKGRLPAVLYVCGHSAEGFKIDVYEKICLNLAAKGFAVLAIDPIGQGERYQYLDSTGVSSVLGGTTNEHSYAGVLCLALGHTVAAVRLWDGIRAIDYLLERPDVDPARIAVQGRSGGGTMSAYLGAMDSRIAAAAPECYIAGFKRIFQSIGPQDAEQNLMSQLKLGLDHGDFLFARAPRPSLIVTTTRDYFSIQGARETFASLKPAFTALGKPGNIGMIEDDAPHMSTRANRERVYSFFMKTFGMTGSTADRDFELVDSARMRVSATGQVVTSGSRTVYDVIRDDAAPLFAGLEKARRDMASHQRLVAEKAASLSGLERNSDTGEIIFRGGIRRDGYRIEKYILNATSDLPLPCLVLVPQGDKPCPAVLLLSPRGKRAEAAPGGLADSLALSGCLVMIPDLPGIGELAANQRGDDSVIRGINYNLLFGAELIGGSITGIQAGAVLRALEYLAGRPEADPQKISAVAIGTTGADLLHAALADNRISSFALLDAPLSWQALFDNQYYDLTQGATVVPGALEYYDLPDLMGLLAPHRLLVVDPLDGQGHSAGKALSSKISRILAPYYKGNEKAFIIRSSGGESTAAILAGWCAADSPAADDNGQQISGLNAEFRQGQVFLTWSETATATGYSINVYLSGSPITDKNLHNAKLLATHIEPHSAHDWWLDPATNYQPGKPSRQGFVIRDGASPLDNSGGLFVHTVTGGEPEPAYYAVTYTTAGGEKQNIAPGVNALTEPVHQKVMSIQPIWLGAPADKPGSGVASGLPTVLHLHGRGGIEPFNWLMFGTGEMGWREGLPFKFYTEVKPDRLLVSPTDRTWMGRTLNESWDARDHFSPVTDTFWYGYNDKVYDKELMPTGTPRNYSERKLLWILSWTRNYFHPDPDRTVLEGGSMGGCGGVSFGLRHPEIFSAIVARVPLVGYFGPEWGGSEKRLTPFCGSMELRTDEGISLRERMDARNLLTRALSSGTDLPYIVISNGRNDGSIPWRPNPRFYRALDSSRQAYVLAWDNLEHSNCMRDCDPWFKRRLGATPFLNFSLKQSYPAFSHCSLDNDPGNGDKNVGDITGYYNFGLEWKDILDEPDSYGVTVFIAAGEPEFPVTLDITPRRLQSFKVKPGQKIELINRSLDGKEVARSQAVVDKTGLVTFEHFAITTNRGNRLIVNKPGS